MQLIWTFVISTIVVIVIAFVYNRWKMNKRMRQLGAVEMVMFHHVHGLPVPYNIPLLVFLCPDKLVIDVKGQPVTVPFQSLSNFGAIDAAQVAESGPFVKGESGEQLYLGNLDPLLKDPRIARDPAKSLRNRTLFVVNAIDAQQAGYVIAMEHMSTLVEPFLAKFRSQLIQSRS